jgi:hypothetical protein
MAKLLYSAVAADGTRTEGMVNAPSVVAARERLEQQGLKQVELRPERPPPSKLAERTDTDRLQSGELARFRQRLLQAQRQPTDLGAVLAALARRSRLWLAADAGLVVYGLATAQPVWMAAGVLAAAAPFALTAWRFRGMDRHRRLLCHYAMGQWDTVRVLAKDLRAISASRPDLDVDLDMRLACIHARDHDLPEALLRLEPWRKRLATRPGSFQAGLAQVHLMAGDTAGFVAQLTQAHDAAPQQAHRTLELALAQARFGSTAQAVVLLGQAGAGSLSPDERALLLWARGLLQLRRREADALPTLAQAVDTWLQRVDDPATWPQLALSACDHAVALHQAGHHEAARERIAQVWPVLEVHATVPLLRMLEADDLLPLRSAANT